MNTGGDQEEQGNTKGRAAAISGSGRNVAIVDHRLDSRDLFVATREITIAHGGDLYRLRLTAQNKLILTK
jgi:hemin uptake protein HemP